MNTDVADTRNADLREGEYFNEKTKSIHCKVCREAREASLPGILGRPPVRVRIKCRCEREEDESLKARDEARERVFRAKRSPAETLQSMALQRYRFECALEYNRGAAVIAKDYVENWQENFSKSRGLAFYGLPGTGKSFLAGCIGNALIAKDVTVLMTDVPTLVGRISRCGWTEKDGLVSSIDFYDLLIIDDLGAQRKSEYVNDLIYEIVNNRYSIGKPMIITTNMLLTRVIEDLEDMNQQRIYSRVLERCIPILVNENNIRKINADINTNKTREDLLLKRLI